MRFITVILNYYYLIGTPVFSLALGYSDSLQSLSGGELSDFGPGIMNDLESSYGYKVNETYFASSELPKFSPGKSTDNTFGLIVSKEISQFISKSHYDEEVALFSNLLLSPVMDKSTAMLGELSFSHPLDGVRSPVIRIEDHYSPRKFINKLFGPSSVSRSVGLLRYGFLSAAIREINEHFSKEGSAIYILHYGLLADPFDENYCVEILNKLNQHLNKPIFQGLNLRIYRILCKSVGFGAPFTDFNTWDTEIERVVNSIKKWTIPAENSVEIQSSIGKTNNMPDIPKIAITGTEIKKRYTNIVASINSIRKKEPLLFNGLIFTKKTALKISTAYLPNGNELVQKCIEIIKDSNPALMREVYQRDKVMQICKITMGD
ncbi:hypothetical protein HWI79_2226 [Cryptosporidium felis]|nr:hypothetical protein HWI79_2226 [Cryptosporidium felis]